VGSIGYRAERSDFVSIGRNECRGDDNKERIVLSYNILPIARFKITPGVTIEGCCGELSDEQVVFQYESKQDKQKRGEFSVGEDCAKKFLLLINMKMPELFDPFSTTSSAGSSEQGGGASVQPLSMWNSLNREIYQAILLWCSLSNQIPKYSTAAILAEIVKNPTKGLSEKNVQDFIKVVSTYRRTLKELVQNAPPSVKMKKFSFPELNAMASKNWIDMP
jgi:hypothetical protein